MNRSIVFSVLLSFCLLVSAGCGDKDKPAAPGTPGTPKADAPAAKPWHDYKAADGSCTAQFPYADFKVSVKEMRGDKGLFKKNQAMWESPDGQTHFLVDHYDTFEAPPGISLKTLAMLAFLDEVKEKIDQGEVSRDGHTGYTANYAKGKQFRQATRFFVGKHTFGLESYTPNTEEGRAMAKQFAESLRILVKP